MGKTKRFTSYVLLYVLGFLSLKILLPSIVDGAQGNCQEFGHIHFYHFSKGHRPLLNISTYENPLSQSDDDDNCHEGKSVFNYSPFPAVVFELPAPIHEVVYDLVYVLDSHFKSPDLELRRKPPKIS